MSTVPVDNYVDRSWIPGAMPHDHYLLVKLYEIWTTEKNIESQQFKALHHMLIRIWVNVVQALPAGLVACA